MEFERDLRKGYVKHNIMRMYYKFVHKMQGSTIIKYLKRLGLNNWFILAQTSRFVSRILNQYEIDMNV